MKLINVYSENGYESRADYLRCLSEDYGVPLADVIAIASLYGASEDFDGLVSSVQDLSDESQFD